MKITENFGLCSQSWQWLSASRFKKTGVHQIIGNVKKLTISQYSGESVHVKIWHILYQVSGIDCKTYCICNNGAMDSFLKRWGLKNIHASIHEEFLSHSVKFPIILIGQFS